jgi:hypothetical protein
MLRRFLAALAIACLGSAALAQNPPAAPPAGSPSASGATTKPIDAPAPELEGRQNQKVERLHHEDDRVVIDELRYAGQTQSIRVKPKNGMPAYEVQPGGTRLWNVLGF